MKISLQLKFGSSFFLFSALGQQRDRMEKPKKDKARKESSVETRREKKHPISILRRARDGIRIDPNQPAGSIPTLITSKKGAAVSSGALAYYDRLLEIYTDCIPNLTHNDPILSGGGHWQYNITCDIQKEAIRSYGRRDS